VGFPIKSPVQTISKADDGLAAANPQAAGLGASRVDGSIPCLGGVDRIALWIAVGGGSGYFPGAPGTAGSLCAAAIFLAMGWGFLRGGTSFSSWPAGVWVGGFCALVTLLFALGVWSSGRAERLLGRKDDGRIVIDEIVGQLVTLSPIALFWPFWSPGRLSGDDFLTFFSMVVTGFVLFRVFDIWKPGAVRWAERRFKGGWGVMADDVVAGGYGAGGLAVIFLCLFLSGETGLGPLGAVRSGVAEVIWLGSGAA